MLRKHVINISCYTNNTTLSLIYKVGMPHSLNKDIEPLIFTSTVLGAHNAAVNATDRNLALRRSRQ